MRRHSFCFNGHSGRGKHFSTGLSATRSNSSCFAFRPRISYNPETKRQPATKHGVLAHTITSHTRNSELLGSLRPWAESDARPPQLATQSHVERPPKQSPRLELLRPLHTKAIDVPARARRSFVRHCPRGRGIPLVRKLASRNRSRRHRHPKFHCPRQSLAYLRS